MLYEMYKEEKYPTLRPATVRNYELAFHADILPAIGRVRIDKLSNSDVVSTWTNARRKAIQRDLAVASSRGRAPNTDVGREMERSVYRIACAFFPIPGKEDGSILTQWPGESQTCQIENLWPMVNREALNDFCRSMK